MALIARIKARRLTGSARNADFNVSIIEMRPGVDGKAGIRFEFNNNMGLVTEYRFDRQELIEVLKWFIRPDEKVRD